MWDEKVPVYNNKTVFDVCGHKLKIMATEKHPFGFVYRLSCKPHCCTHPNGIEIKIGEDHLVELVQKKIAETKFMSFFAGKYITPVRGQLSMWT